MSQKIIGRAKFASHNFVPFRTVFNDTQVAVTERLLLLIKELNHPGNACNKAWQKDE
jgi:hypothetical protein